MAMERLPSGFEDLFSKGLESDLCFMPEPVLAKFVRQQLRLIAKTLASTVSVQAPEAPLRHHESNRILIYSFSIYNRCMAFRSDIPALILAVLGDGSAHGYQIVRKLRESGTAGRF